ncbi:MAG: hypothetical protein ABSF77_13755 [Spirochaetia bacterium]|jgi:hypothetical protein
MSTSECPRFDACSCPICPLDSESAAYVSWFPNETVCPRKDFAGLSWIRRQRKIVHVLGLSFEAGSFTHRMLLQDFIVRRGLTGLDPDRGSSDRTEAAWLQAHPERKFLTDAQRAVLRARVKKSGVFRSAGSPKSDALDRAPEPSTAEIASAQEVGP